MTLIIVAETTKHFERAFQVSDLESLDKAICRELDTNSNQWLLVSVKKVVLAMASADYKLINLSRD